MTKTRKTNTKNALPILTQALLDCFSPLVSALDGETDSFGDLQARNDAIDSGQTLPSVRDNGLKFILNGMITQLWRQNYGLNAQRDKDGNIVRTFFNNQQSLHQSMERKAAIQEKLEKAAKGETTVEVEGTLTDADLAAIHWLRVNEARYSAVEELLQSLCYVYSATFHEEWKAPEAPAPVASAKPRIKMTAAEALATLQAFNRG